MAFGVELPGSAPILFFAPITRAGASAAGPRLGCRIEYAKQCGGSLDSAARWLRIVDGGGQVAVESVYHAMLDGKVDPAEEHVLLLWAR
jgi:hypothetical protein